MANTITYKVGDNAQGGVVFWVDETGQHGLVAALQDVSGPIFSPALSLAFTPPSSGGKGAGYLNTANILSVLLNLQVSRSGSPVTSYTSVATDVAGMITNFTGQGNTSECSGLSTPSINAACYDSWYIGSREEVQSMVAGLCNVDSDTIPDYSPLVEGANYWTSNINYFNANAGTVIYTTAGTIPNASCSGGIIDVRTDVATRVRAIRQF